MRRFAARRDAETRLQVLADQLEPHLARENRRVWVLVTAACSVPAPHDTAPPLRSRPGHVRDLRCPAHRSQRQLVEIPADPTHSARRPAARGHHRVASLHRRVLERAGERTGATSVRPLVLAWNRFRPDGRRRPQPRPLRLPLPHGQRPSARVMHGVRRPGPVVRPGCGGAPRGLRTRASSGRSAGRVRRRRPRRTSDGVP